jgi:hypothetical protein
MEKSPSHEISNSRKKTPHRKSNRCHSIVNPRTRLTCEPASTITLKRCSGVYSCIVRRKWKRCQKHQIGRSQQIRFIDRVVSRFPTRNLNIFAKKGLFSTSLVSRYTTSYMYADFHKYLAVIVTHIWSSPTGMLPPLRKSAILKFHSRPCGRE